MNLCQQADKDSYTGDVFALIERNGSTAELYSYFCTGIRRGGPETAPALAG